VFAVGSIRAAPVPRFGQIAPGHLEKSPPPSLIG